VSNVEKNVLQRVEHKQRGGITGRGFVPGKSGNPTGRPRTQGLVRALLAKVLEIGPDGRSIEQQLVDVLVQEALRGRHRLAAVATIFDRLEGRARQQIEVADVTKELRDKSDDELRFHLEQHRTDCPLLHPALNCRRLIKAIAEPSPLIPYCPLGSASRFSVLGLVGFWFGRMLQPTFLYAL
jgi:hypothetical protein